MPLIYLSRKSQGFSLIELAIVLVVVSLLIGYLIIPLGAQSEKRYIAEARQQMSEIEQALLGFAIANGRLPCPATVSPVPSNGVENPLGGSTPAIPCVNNARGFLPAVTLGVNGSVNCDGLLMDPWGQPYRYSVTTVTNNVYTNPNPNGVTAANLPALIAQNNLQICADAACATTINSNAVAVVYSTGKNWAFTASNDELENAGEGTEVSNCGLPNYGMSNDNRYVFKQRSSAAGLEYDDIMIWISPSVLFSKLLDAGRI